MLSKHLKFRFFWNLFIFIDNIWIKTKNWLLDLYFRKKTLVLCVLYVKSGLIQREERRYDVYFSGLRYPCFPLNLAPFIFPNNQSSNFITSSIGIISASLVQLALVSFSSLLLSIFFQPFYEEIINRRPIFDCVQIQRKYTVLLTWPNIYMYLLYVLPSFQVQCGFAMVHVLRGRNQTSEYT